MEQSLQKTSGLNSVTFYHQIILFVQCTYFIIIQYRIALFQLTRIIPNINLLQQGRLSNCYHISKELNRLLQMLKCIIGFIFV